MSDAALSAERDGIVTDFTGRHYVAVHPGYTSSPTQYRRVLATRIAVCVLAFLALILNVVAEVVPYYSKEDRYYYSYLGVVYYTPWEYWYGSATDKSGVSFYLSLAGIMGIVGLALCLIAVILCGVLAGAWPRAERDRLEERANSEVALAKYGHRRQEYGDADGTDAFPYTNLRVMNRGQVGEVPYETRELARRQYDKDLCAAALSMLILADIFALTSVALMGADYNYEKTNDNYYYVANTSHYVYYYKKVRVEAGIPLMAVSTALLFVAFIVVSIPQITGVHLCGSLSPARCVLMVMDGATAREVGDQLQRLTATDNPLFLDGAAGVRVALPGVPMGDLIASYNQHSAAPAAFQGRGGNETANGYTSATYYEAPPQLYDVRGRAGAEDTAEVVVQRGAAEGEKKKAVCDVSWGTRAMEEERDDTCDKRR